MFLSGEAGASEAGAGEAGAGEAKHEWSRAAKDYTKSRVIKPKKDISGW